MSRSSMALGMRRAQPAKAPDASYCRAGLPAPGDRRPSMLCPQRQQCAQHQRYMKLVASGAKPGTKDRVMVLPFVPGRQCHYFELVK